MTAADVTSLVASLRALSANQVYYEEVRDYCGRAADALEQQAAELAESRAESQRLAVALGNVMQEEASAVGEIRRLRAALERIANHEAPFGLHYTRLQEIARAELRRGLDFLAGHCGGEGALVWHIWSLLLPGLTIL